MKRLLAVAGCTAALAGCSFGDASGKVVVALADGQTVESDVWCPLGWAKETSDLDGIPGMAHEATKALELTVHARDCRGMPPEARFETLLLWRTVTSKSLFFIPLPQAEAFSGRLAAGKTRVDAGAAAKMEVVPGKQSSRFRMAVRGIAFDTRGTGLCDCEGLSLVDFVADGHL